MKKIVATLMMMFAVSASAAPTLDEMVRVCKSIDKKDERSQVIEKTKHLGVPKIAQSTGWVTARWTTNDNGSMCMLHVTLTSSGSDVQVFCENGTDAWGQIKTKWLCSN